MTVIHGIATCDTVRKARNWLRDNGIDHRYHDLRRDGVSSDDLARWLDVLGWETLVNRRSATWRSLPASERGKLDDGNAVDLLAAHPTLIKRPVLESGSGILVGFTPDGYRRFFG